MIRPNLSLFWFAVAFASLSGLARAQDTAPPANDPFYLGAELPPATPVYPDPLEPIDPQLIVPPPDPLQLETEAGFAEAAQDAPDPPARPSGRPKGGFGGKSFGPAGDYRVTWFADAAVAGQSTDLGFVQQDFSFNCPLPFARGWSLSTNIRSELFQTDAVLPDTQQAFPDELWNVRIGANYLRPFENGWVGGLTVNVGSASNQPFASWDETNVMLLGFLRVPHRDRNAWVFSLIYAPNSELPFPLPGVAYSYEPSDYFKANIGVPFQLMYRPTEKLTLDFSYMLLRTIRARATYAVRPELRFYAGYDWGNESYWLTERTDRDDRLFYYDMRLGGGVQWDVGRYGSVELAGGYTFERMYFEGENWDDQDFNQLEVGNSAYLSLQWQRRW